LKPSELVAALRPLPSATGTSDQQLEAVAKYLGADKAGGVNYLELVAGVEVLHMGGGTRAPGNRIERPSPASLLEDLVEAIGIIIVYEYGLGTLRHLLRRASSFGSTRCTPDIFRRVLEVLSAGAAEMRLSGQQIDCLVASLQVGSSSDFDFEEFLSSFEILDTMTDQRARFR